MTNDDQAAHWKSQAWVVRCLLSVTFVNLPPIPPPPPYTIGESIMRVQWSQ